MLDQDLKINLGRAHQEDRRELNSKESTQVHVRVEKAWVTLDPAGGSCMMLKKLGVKNWWMMARDRDT